MEKEREGGAMGERACERRIERNETTTRKREERAMEGGPYKN